MATMAGAPRLYAAEYQRYHASRPGFHVNEIRLLPAQSISWHFHSKVQDTFFVIEGCLHIFLREPEEEVSLGQGETCTVVARRPHRVVNGGRDHATFPVLQGFGEYDFIPLT